MQSRKWGPGYGRYATAIELWKERRDKGSARKCKPPKLLPRVGGETSVTKQCLGGCGIIARQPYPEVYRVGHERCEPPPSRPQRRTLPTNSLHTGGKRSVSWSAGAERLQESGPTVSEPPPGPGCRKQRPPWNVPSIRKKMHRGCIPILTPSSLRARTQYGTRSRPKALRLSARIVGYAGNISIAASPRKISITSIKENRKAR